YMVGPLAAMMAYYSAYEFPAVAILPYADAGGADPLAAKEAVELVARILGVEVDTSELLRLAEEKAKLERELEEVRKRAERGEEVPTFYV
ncbi:MAG: proteasome assembly chaperone family protein, partial [Thermoprotei archaeon]